MSLSPYSTPYQPVGRLAKYHITCLPACANTFLHGVGNPAGQPTNHIVYQSVIKNDWNGSSGASLSALFERRKSLIIQARRQESAVTASKLHYR
jgi:hypothetical protein